MKYGEARYEDQMYADGPLGAGASDSKPLDLKMVNPEGLTPGYEGNGKDAHLAPLSEQVPLAQKEEVPGEVIDPVEQMNTLLTKKIEATLAGDTEAVEKLERMLELHAERNGIPYETL